MTRFSGRTAMRRGIAMLGAAGFALMLAACASPGGLFGFAEETPEPVPAVPGVLPAAPQMPEGAAEFVAYAAALDSIDVDQVRAPGDVAALSGGLGVRDADALARAFVLAAAAEVAADPGFRAGVAAGRTDAGDDGFAAMLARPGAARAIAGAETALGVADAQMRARAAKLAELGQRLEALAFAFQKDRRIGWFQPAPLRMAAAGATQTGAVRLYANAILPVAARLVLGQTPEAGVPADLRTCLNWVRLNTDQCFAAARRPSERAFCASRHVTAEAAACWAR